MIKKIFLIAFVFTGFINRANSQNIISKEKLIHTNLKQDYNYGAFTANKKYLVWGEFYTGTISVYNLKTHHLEEVRLKRGRGPHEYSFYTDLTLTSTNKLIIGDSQGMKLIIYDLDLGKFNRDIELKQLRPYRLAAVNNIIFSLNLLFRNKSIYDILDIHRKKEKLKAIDMASINVMKEFKNPFKRDGDITANKNYGVHITRYFPDLYICNLKSHKFLKKIQFDQWNTKKGKTTSLNGHKAFTAPTDVDVEDKDIAFVPDMEHTILILAQGKGKQRNYDLRHIRAFNFKEEKFKKTFDLGVKAHEIAVNNKYLFVYSKDKNAIFQYKIVSSKKTAQ